MFYGYQDDSVLHFSVNSTENHHLEHTQWQKKIRCLLFFNRSMLKGSYISDLCIRMKQLRVLDLSCTGLLKLPDCISDLKHLRYLSLQGNPITELPESLGHLYVLETLNLTNNMIHVLPDSICFLKRLHYLSLRSTHIRNH